LKLFQDVFFLINLNGLVWLIVMDLMKFPIVGQFERFNNSIFVVFKNEILLETKIL
jgi:hypothetical protein